MHRTCPKCILLQAPEIEKEKKKRGRKSKEKKSSNNPEALVISSDESLDGFDIKQYFISDKDKHNKKENDKKEEQKQVDAKKKRKRLIESSDSEEDVPNNETKERICKTNDLNKLHKILIK